jgi:hypothetical protein
MKSLILSIFFTTTLILGSCNNEDASGTKESETENNFTINDSSISMTCIYDIKINYPLPSETSPDELEIYIQSSDSILSNVLDLKAIDEILFQRSTDSTINEDRSGLSLRVTQIKASHYKLSYMTSHFIFDPVDTAQEGSDLMQTAKLFVKSTDGRRWEIKTCPQVH